MYGRALGLTHWFDPCLATFRNHLGLQPLPNGRWSRSKRDVIIIEIRLEILEILKLPKQIYVKGSFLFPQFVNMNSSVEPLVASGIMMEPLMSSRYHLAVAGNHEMTQTLGG